MKELNKRLKLIRKALGLTQKEMSNMMGVSLRVYQYYEKGEQKPTYEKLVPLVEKFNINGNWLLTGQGEMFLNGSSQKNIGINYGGMQIGNIIGENVKAKQEINQILQEIRAKNPQAYKKVIHKLKQEAGAVR